MNSNFDPEKFIGLKIQDVQVTFTQDDAIIYALGIGFSQDPLKQGDLKYTYELNDQFTVFPTFGACFHKVNLIGILANTPGWPSFNPAMLLHAQQKLQIISSALKPNVPYVIKAFIKDVVDKGKMTLVCLELDVFQKLEGGNLMPVLNNQTTLALLKFNAKGYKGKGNISHLPPLPRRNPDYNFEAVSYPNQAILYRLTGDKNPLHIDPKFASIQKLPRPIIHGMASKGILTRTIIQNLLNNDPYKLKSIHTRFTGHVFCGQSFQIHVWKQDGYFTFEAKCKERGTIIMKGAFEVKQSAKL